MHDPAPVSAHQIGALAAVAARELCWVLPSVSRHVRDWRDLARTMPAGPLRHDALATLAAERFNTEGAALFATLPRRRSPALLRLLVAYEVMWDYLDTVSERECGQTVRNGLQLHRALAEALDPYTPISDYYRYSPWSDDGGYLEALVTTCRALCVQLPAYTRVREHVVRLATQAKVSAINHEPDRADRDEQLQAWASSHLPPLEGVSWFELTGAATSSLTIHALLALAAEPRCAEREIADTHAAYFPWVSLASTMLDSYADMADDAATGAHSYVAHYPSLSTAEARISEIVGQAAACARRLPRGERHVLIVAGMVAMYLSNDSTRTRELRAATIRMVGAPGRLPRLLVPMLRVWRLTRREALSCSDRMNAARSS